MMCSLLSLCHTTRWNWWRNWETLTIRMFILIIELVKVIKNYCMMSKMAIQSVQIIILARNDSTNDLNFLITQIYLIISSFVSQEFLLAQVKSLEKNKIGLIDNLEDHLPSNKELFLALWKATTPNPNFIQVSTFIHKILCGLQYINVIE